MSTFGVPDAVVARAIADLGLRGEQIAPETIAAEIVRRFRRLQGAEPISGRRPTGATFEARQARAVEYVRAKDRRERAGESLSGRNPTSPPLPSAPSDGPAGSVA